MQMDSTPLDVLVRLDDGVAGRIDLTGMIDVATRTVTAAVLRPATKSVDASVLLARTVTPEAMRPGWADALAMSRSALPWHRLLDIDTRLEHAAARPVIIPETVIVDQGKVFVSRNFRASCNFLGINFQPVHGGSGWEKGHIERMLGSVGTLFAQFVAGYAGFNAERRGRRAEQQAVWSLLELQELLDEWIVAAGRTAPMRGCATPPIPDGCSARTRNTLRWSRRPATSRSRCRPRTMSNCCPRICLRVNRDARLSWGGLPAPGRGLSSVRPDACHLIVLCMHGRMADWFRSRGPTAVVRDR